jgi:hypothetical protein
MTTLTPRLRFASSLRALAQFAMRETSAVGWSLVQYAPDGSGANVVSSLGTAIPSTVLTEPAPDRLIVLPLAPVGADAWVAFAFADSEAAASAAHSIPRFVEAFSAIWATRHRDSHYAALLRRISLLENELMDSRIADRINGLLHGPSRADALDTIAGHVSSVLNAEGATEVLRTTLRQLEEEVDERRVTGRAKAILQATAALTEEEAHLRLRAMSRRTRRRVRDIALDILRQHQLQAKTA